MQEHIVPIRIYLLVYASLMVLTILTILISYHDLGLLNNVAALTIAVTKVTLVVLFFMHVRYSPSLTKLVATGAFLWLIILLSLTMTDYISRSWLTMIGR